MFYQKSDVYWPSNNNNQNHYTPLIDSHLTFSFYCSLNLKLSNGAKPHQEPELNAKNLFLTQENLKTIIVLTFKSVQTKNLLTTHQTWSRKPPRRRNQRNMYTKWIKKRKNHIKYAPSNFKIHSKTKLNYKTIHCLASIRN